jgi:hypothetical protein
VTPDLDSEGLPPEQEGEVAALLADAAQDDPLPTTVAARLDDTLAALTADRAAREGSSPEQEARVSALLSDAAGAVGGAAIPAEVAARLDDTLAGLTADRSPVPPPVPLTARRRRWPKLVAAASVAVVAGGIGVAVVHLAGQDTAGMSSAGAGGRAAEDSSVGSDGSPTPQPSTQRSQGAVPGAAPTKRGQEGVRGPAYELASPSPAGGSGSDVTKAVVASGLLGSVTQQSPNDQRPGALGARLPRSTCETPKLARGDRSAVVRLHGRPVTVVVRRPAGGLRIAHVYACRQPFFPIATRTLPAGR